MMPVLHFIFLARRDEQHTREWEMEYVRDMAGFFADWIRGGFSRAFRVQADMMIAERRGLFKRLDTHHLVDDHRSRGGDTYHFYLADFRPLWTDCTCEGYHAENFGMVWWQRPPKGDVAFMAKKNCTVVSHEICHELLRQAGSKKYISSVHDVWTKHFYSDLPFRGYGPDHQHDNNDPRFMTIDLERVQHLVTE